MSVWFSSLTQTLNSVLDDVDDEEQEYQNNLNQNSQNVPQTQTKEQDSSKESDFFSEFNVDTKSQQKKNQVPLSNIPKKSSTPEEVEEDFFSSMDPTLLKKSKSSAPKQNKKNEPKHKPKDILKNSQEILNKNDSPVYQRNSNSKKRDTQRKLDF